MELDPRSGAIHTAKARYYQPERGLVSVHRRAGIQTQGRVSTHGQLAVLQPCSLLSNQLAHGFPDFILSSEPFHQVKSWANIQQIKVKKQ